MARILDRENPILRKIARDVSPRELRSREIRSLVAAMKKTLAGEPDGVALAAPQVGASLRIFIVAGKVLRKKKDEPPAADLVFANPKIVRHSRKKVPLEEGCLSVRPLYGRVPRYERVTIEALDDRGEPVRRGASGLLAQIFQHEIDHLDGILFTDRAAEIFELPPEALARGRGRPA